MNLTYDNARKFFRAASRLLDYPDAQWRQDLTSVESILHEIPDCTQAEALLDFIQAARAATAREFESRYVDTFDFSNKTSLHLTSRERADAGIQRMDLIAYSVYFEEAGFEAPDDLPDSLPVLLELASQLDNTALTRLARDIDHDIELLERSLIEHHVVDYAAVIAAIHDVIRLVNQEEAA